MPKKPKQTKTPDSNAPIDPDKNLKKSLIFAHDAIGNNFVSVNKCQAHLYALIETLVSKGVISLHEIDERKQKVDEQMMTSMKEKWIGARIMENDKDKYDPDNCITIDCENRVHLCKAACCKLGFYLSRQDIEEGEVQWDFERPYHIAQKKGGACVHHEQNTCRCKIWEKRPLVCRGYDCRNDKRIWNDFDKKIPNQELEKL